jgi:hypothetical protein
MVCGCPVRIAEKYGALGGAGSEESGEKISGIGF